PTAGSRAISGSCDDYSGFHARDTLNERKGPWVPACAGTTGSAFREFLPRQRIRPQLDLDRLRPVLLAALEVEVHPRARSRPQPSSLPPGFLVVDPAVDVLREEPRRIRQPQDHELAVDERHDR